MNNGAYPSELLQAMNQLKLMQAQNVPLPADHFVYEPLNEMIELFESTMRDSLKLLAPLKTSKGQLKTLIEPLSKWSKDYLAQFKTPASQPNALHRQACLTWITKLHTYIVTDIALSQTIANNPALSDCAGRLLLICSILQYDIYVERLNDKNETLQTKLDLIDVLRSGYIRSDNYLGPNPPNSYDKIRLQLLQKIRKQLGLHHPDWMGFKELRHHIDDINKRNQAQPNFIPLELICNPKATAICGLDRDVSINLLNKINAIRGTSERRQFIVDIVGQMHALIVDVSWNKDKSQLEVICVDPSNQPHQQGLIDNIVQNIPKLELIAIQAHLQHDMQSCYVFSLALSGVLRKRTFAELAKHDNVDNISFHDPLNLGNRSKTLPRVAWKSVTALGEKAVIMDQSKTSMHANLTALYPKKPDDVTKLIARCSRWYALDSSVPAASNKPRSYIHHRREQWRKKYKGVTTTDLNVNKVLELCETKDTDQALRRLAAGWCPLRMLKFMLSHVDKAHVNVQGGTEQRTPLHWAQIQGQRHRAEMLIKAGASDEIRDVQGKRPSEYRKIPK